LCAIYLIAQACIHPLAFGAGTPMLFSSATIRRCDYRRAFMLSNSLRETLINPLF
jgi:hypothetical protein